MRHGQDHPLGDIGRADYAPIFQGRRDWERPGDSTRSKLRELSGKMRSHNSLPTNENAGIPAGYTYLGQLIIHDLTQFRRPTAWSGGRAGQRNRNVRSAGLDLDCVYGRGPAENPLLYEASKEDHSAFRYVLRQGKLAEPVPPRGSDKQAGCPFDIPRLTEDGAGISGGRKNVTADPIIADPRNDDHLIISQLHLLFIHLHNRVALCAKQQGLNNQEAYLQARGFVVRCYRDVIRHDFLKRLLLKPVYEDFLRETPGFVRLPSDSPMDRTGAVLPIEFATAAGRIGHGMARNEYKVNRFVDLQDSILPKLLKLSGFDRRAPLTADWVVEWSNFFGEAAMASQKITPFVSHHLDNFKPRFGADPKEKLTFLDLWRACEEGLPSGQEMAEMLGHHIVQNGGGLPVPVLSGKKMLPDAFEHEHGTRAKKLGDFLREHPALQEHTPLYYYLLQEAAVLGKGCRLGPLGSFIMALTFRLAFPDEENGAEPIVLDMPELLSFLDDPAALENASARWRNTSR